MAMRRTLLLVLMGILLVCGGAPFARAAESVSGKWLVTADLHGTPYFGTLELVQQGEKITGHLLGSELEGTVRGTEIQFVAKNGPNESSKVDGTIKNGVLSAIVLETDVADEAHPDR